MTMAKSKIVKANERIAEKVTGTFENIKDTVVGGYSRIEDAFVDRYLTKDGETVADAKERLKKNRKTVTETAKNISSADLAKRLALYSILCHSFLSVP